MAVVVQNGGVSNPQTSGPSIPHHGRAVNEGCMFSRGIQSFLRRTSPLACSG